MAGAELPPVFDGLEYYKLPRDVFEAAYRTARTETQAAKRVTACVRFFFTNDAALLQGGSDSAAFLLQYRSRIDRARGCAIAAIERKKGGISPAETHDSGASDLRRYEPLNVDTDRDKREENIGEEKRDDALTGNPPQQNRQVRRKRLRSVDFPNDVPVREHPPTAEAVLEYGRAKGFEAFAGDDGLEEAKALIDYNESQGWVTSGGEIITDWRGVVRIWDDRYLQKREESALHPDRQRFTAMQPSSLGF